MTLGKHNVFVEHQPPLGQSFLCLTAGEEDGSGL